MIRTGELIDEFQCCPFLKRFSLVQNKAKLVVPGQSTALRRTPRTGGSLVVPSWDFQLRSRHAENTWKSLSRDCHTAASELVRTTCRRQLESAFFKNFFKKKIQKFRKIPRIWGRGPSPLLATPLPAPVKTEKSYCNAFQCLNPCRNTISLWLHVSNARKRWSKQ